MPIEEKSPVVESPVEETGGDPREVVEGETPETTTQNNILDDEGNVDISESVISLESASPYLSDSFIGYAEIPIGITLVLILCTLLVSLVLGRRTL